MPLSSVHFLSWQMPFCEHERPLGQTFPHAPQLSSDVGLMHLPLHAIKPSLQIGVHLPSVQISPFSATFAGSHACLHVPHVCGEDRSASHPFEGSPSQSANPGLQVNSHVPLLHLPSETLGNSAHVRPGLSSLQPQCSGLLDGSMHAYS